MSETNFKVNLTSIKSVNPHGNAHSLDLVSCYGYEIITGKGVYKVGDLVVYIPIDSVIPQKLEDFLFPQGSKISRSGSKNRIRQIRIRGVPSQGMVVSPQDIYSVYNFTPTRLEKDYSVELGITKYEPPEVTSGTPGQNKTRLKAKRNPYFKDYNGLNNVKWYPEKFSHDEVVQIEEKAHGSNIKLAWVPYVPLTFWDKLKHSFWKLFGREHKWEYCFGSNTTQLQNREDYSGYYGSNIYKFVSDKYKMHQVIQPGETWYGEVYGKTDTGTEIQKGYTYGASEPKVIFFDITVLQPDGTTKYLNPPQSKHLVESRGLTYVPVLYVGPYVSMKNNEQYTLGPSVLDPKTKVREGCVIKAVENYDQQNGEKKALKFISSKYLDDKTNSDNH